MKWGIDLGRFDKEVSGEVVWILFAGIMVPALFILLGGAMVVHSWRDREGLEMLVGGALALAVEIGLIVTGCRRQLAWGLGIGWGSLLAYGAMVEYGPPIIRGAISWIVGICVIGWELLASITRLEWIILVGFAVVVLFLWRITAILTLAVDNQIEQATSIMGELERIRLSNRGNNVLD